MDHKIDWLPAFTITIFGALFLYESFQIAVPSQGSSARMVPTTASGLVLILGLSQLVKSLSGKTHNSKDHIRLREFVTLTGPIILLMMVYGYFHHLFGYFIATLLCSVVAFKIFENSWRTSLLHATIGTIILYFLFIRVLGVYDPPGRLIDLTEWF